MPLTPALDSLIVDLDSARQEVGTRIMPLVVSDNNAKYQASYLQSRMIDLGVVIERLGSQNMRLIVLAHREDRLMPQKRPPVMFSKKLQAVMGERDRIVARMRIDLESLYIFGNLILDYWASVVGYIYSLPGSASWSYPYADLHRLIVSSSPPAALQPLINAHDGEIYWLYYNLRVYRNGFIEHIDRPMQRGATTPTFSMGFSSHMPAASGSISDTEKTQLFDSIAHIATQFTNGLPQDHWQRLPEGSLQTMFHRIDEIVNYADREAVSKVWRKLGGESVSYEVLVRHLVNLLSSSVSTLSLLN